MSDLHAVPARATSSPGRRRHLSTLLMLVGLVAVVVALGFWWVGRSPQQASAVAGDHPAAGTTTPATSQAPARSRGASAGRVPTALVIPALGVRVPVVPIAAQGSTLVPPDDPQVIGWWRDGARPGATRGSALLTGHTVHTGGGALDHLGSLRPGASVTVRTATGPLHYVVRSVRTYAKGRIARDAKSLFDQTVPGRLVVVTCSHWNGSVYLANTVVTAVPTGRS